MGRVQPFPSVSPLVELQTRQESSGGQGTPPVSPILAPAAIYLSGLAPITRTTSRGRLDTLAALMLPGSDATTFPWHQLTYRETAQVRAVLEARYHYRTANNFLYCLRGILRECFNLGLLSSDAYARAIAFQTIKGSSLPAGRYVEPEEWQRFFANLADDRTPLGARDLAMFAVLRATGMRRAELLGMEVEDANLRDMTFQVVGKGNKAREVAADVWIRPFLETWLRLRGSRVGALFCAVYRNGHVDPECKPLSPSNLHVVLQQRVKQAGVPRFSLHDFRRAMATNLWDADVNPKAICDQGGWERVETAMRYDRRPKQRIRKAVTNIPSPFEARDDAKYDAEYDRGLTGKPSPWIPDEGDMEMEDS